METDTVNTDRLNVIEAMHLPILMY